MSLRHLRSFRRAVRLVSEERARFSCLLRADDDEIASERTRFQRRDHNTCAVHLARVERRFACASRNRRRL